MSHPEWFLTAAEARTLTYECLDQLAIARQRRLPLWEMAFEKRLDWLAELIVRLGDREAAAMDIAGISVVRRDAVVVV